MMLLLCCRGGVLVIRSASSEQKRYAGILEARLKDCGVEFKAKSEAELGAGDLDDASVLVLPFNPALGETTRDRLPQYVVRGGKFLAFYDTDEAVLRQLGIEKIQYQLHKPGSIQGVSFEKGPDILSAFPGMMAHRGNSVMAPTLMSGTLPIAHWVNGTGKPFGIAATLNRNGIYFCAAYLDQDAVNGGDFLLAALAICEPDVWRQRAAKLRSTTLTFSGENTVAQLEARIARCGRKELRAVLAQACAAKKNGDASYGKGRYQDAVSEYRKAEELGSRVFVESAASRPGELRGVWCHSAYGVSGYSWDEVVRALAANGFNALFLNACWADLADYPSTVLFNAPAVAEKGDQIAQCLKACRKYGVELHIWRVCLNLGYRYPADKLEAMQKANRTQKTATGEDSAFLAPHVAENIALELNAIGEIAEKYEVDGIHLDYIRYSSSRFDYSSGSREAFEASLGRKVQDWPAECQAGGSLFQEFCSWRCGNISDIVKGARQRMAKAGSKARLSVAVYPEWNNSPEWIGQDVREWIDKGWIDFVCPMDYSADMEEYTNWLEAQYDCNRGRVPVYIGIGLYKQKGIVPSLQQLELARKMGHDGFVCFDLKKPFLEETLPLLGKGACSGKAASLPHHAKPIAFDVPFGERILDGAFREGATVFINVALPRQIRNGGLTVSLEQDGVDLGGRGLAASFTPRGLRVSLNAEKAGRYRLRLDNGGFVARSPVIHVMSPSEIRQQLIRKGPPLFANNGGIKVGVWHDGAYGAQPILDALSSMAGIDAAVLHNTSPDNLAECRVVVLPQVRRRPEHFKSEETVSALREFVRNGGGLLLTHAMTGTRSFPNLFPDVVSSVNQVPLKERYWRYARGRGGAAFSQTGFVDMIAMTPGKNGVRFLESKGGDCTMVIGRAAKGKYAACGLGLGIGAGDKDTELSPQEKSLLFKTIEWLTK